jgi:hypothetical protein
MIYREPIHFFAETLEPDATRILVQIAYDVLERTPEPSIGVHAHLADRANLPD